MSDHYRLGWEAVLAAAFALFLILFAGRTGVRALASFALTILAMWKILVPLYLRGFNPIWIGLALTLFLTVMIIGWSTASTGGAWRRCPGPSWASWSPACWG